MLLPKIYGLLACCLPLSGCAKIDCEPSHPEWCAPSLSLSALTPNWLDLAQGSAAITMTVTSANLSPMDPYVQAQVMQADGMWPALSVLPPTDDLAWQIAVNPTPLSCGEATLQIQAGMLASRPGSFYQTGSTTFTVFNGRPLAFQKQDQQVITAASGIGYSAISKLTVGAMSSGYTYLYAGLDQAFQSTNATLGFGRLDGTWHFDQKYTDNGVTVHQYVGGLDHGATVLVTKQTPSCNNGATVTACTNVFSSNDILACEMQFNRQHIPIVPCLLLSLTLEHSGSYFAAATNPKMPGNLLIEEVVFGAGVRDLAALNPVTLPTSVPNSPYRHVATGNLDGTGRDDLIALRSPGQPVLLSGDGYTPISSLANWMHTNVPELESEDAVVAFGRLKVCTPAAQSDLLVASGNKIIGVVSLDGAPLAQSHKLARRDITLPMLPAGTITALQLTDLNLDGKDDMLVAVSPDPSCTNMCTPSTVALYLGQAG